MRCALHNKEHCIQVCRQHCTPVLEAHVTQIRDCLQSGVVHDHRWLAGGKHCINSRLIGQVRLDGNRTTQITSESDSGSLIPVIVHDDLCPGLNKTRGDAVPNIATGPGYENRFARQVKYVAVHAMSRQLNCAIVHEMGRNEKPERYTSERCWISEILNDLHWPEFSIARCRVEPGVTTELHSLSVHEVYVIEHGCGLMRVGSKAPYEVGPGDTVTIPKQVAQNISNIGDSDLVFTCVCSPRFSQNCYTSRE